MREKALQESNLSSSPSSLDQPPPFFSQTPTEVAGHFSSDCSNGLRVEDARKRRSENGPNRLVSKAAPSILRQLWQQVADVTVFALVVAAAIAALVSFVQEESLSFLESYGDSIAIMVIVVLNAILGLLQERKADRAIKALAKMTNPKAHVIRDGEIHTISAEDVVCGDVLKLAAGDRVAADARIISAERLDVNESTLTGESAAIRKTSDKLEENVELADRRNMVFDGQRSLAGEGVCNCCGDSNGDSIGSNCWFVAKY